MVTVAESRRPITTMGGLRMVPDMLLADLEPADSDLLILPGATMWDAGGGRAFAATAGRFLEAGVPVAAICGATAGLARAGLLDERRHTSADPGYLAATGYAGGDHYIEARGRRRRPHHRRPAVARAVRPRRWSASERTLEAYEGVFHRADAAAFDVLVQAQPA